MNRLVPVAPPKEFMKAKDEEEKKEMYQFKLPKGMRKKGAPDQSAMSTNAGPGSSTAASHASPNPSI